MKNNQLAFFLLMAFGIVSCSQSVKQIDETPTRGSIKIGVDDSYRLLMDTEILYFTNISIFGFHIYLVSRSLKRV